MRMIAIVMLAAGVLALVYGGFSYTKQTHEAKLGPVEFSVSENSSGPTLASWVCFV